jgi:uncharacterized protein YihD (DUF1040 family)
MIFSFLTLISCVFYLGYIQTPWLPPFRQDEAGALGSLSNLTKVLAEKGEFIDVLYANENLLYSSDGRAFNSLTEIVSIDVIDKFYDRGETVTVNVVVKSNSNVTESFVVKVQFQDPWNKWYDTTPQSVTLPPRATQTITFLWTIPSSAPSGPYNIRASLWHEGNCIHYRGMYGSFMVASSKKPSWAKAGIYLTYASVMQEIELKPEEVERELKELKDFIDTAPLEMLSLFTLNLTEVTDELVIVHLKSLDREETRKFSWKELNSLALWEDLNVLSVANLPLEEIETRMGKFLAYKLQFESEETAAKFTIGYHKNTGISLLRMMGRPGTVGDLIVFELVDTNLAIKVKPDLTITFTKVSPLKMSKEGKLIVEFSEKNQGNANSGDFITRIYLGKTEYGCDYTIGDTGVHSLKAGENRTFKFELPIPAEVPSGIYYVTTFIDCFNEIDEENEDNNVESTTPENIIIAMYELFIEIDYMLGHKPTQSVLDYIEEYYLQRDILITFYVDDEVPLDSEVTLEEFFKYEAQYNDMGDDKIIYHWRGREYKLTVKWKWVLYGTVDARSSITNGYAYTGGRDDAGNYIFIADERNDRVAIIWEEQGVTAEEVETVVLMHELGHTIGIIRYNEEGCEIFDSHMWSVMATLTPANCNANPIRYSSEYWELRNMEYYIIGE